MADAKPRVYADERGIWREDTPGHPFGIPWDEIIGVGGYKLDGITEVFTVVELDHASGHGLELHAEWPGFAQVASELTARFPDMPTSWFAEIARLQPRQAATTVWRR